MKKFFTQKKCLVLFLFLCLSKLGFAQLPYMVKDIGVGGPSNPSNLTNIGGILYFTASNPSDNYGDELWRSDGTRQGTYMVKDISPGSGSSQTVGLIDINGTLFFRADDGYGYRLWKSDGTPEGTVMVASEKDVWSPGRIANVNGVAYFRGTSSAYGNELWKSDGTPEGTVMVKDIIEGTGSSFIGNLTDVNGVLYFKTMHSGGSELWKSDGTPEGTVMVKNFSAMSSFPDLANFTNLNGTLYFTADDGQHGLELWKSDGTPEGTELVKDINPGFSGSGITQIFNAGGTLYFMANDISFGFEPWKSDGTPEGTVLLKNIAPSWVGSNPNRFTNVNGIVYFTADDYSNGTELWKTDGTPEGTVMVKDIQPGTWESFITELVDVNGTLYFVANVSNSGKELWKSNGTEEGTIIVKDIYPDYESAEPYYLTNVGGKLYFGALTVFDGVDYGRELWSIGTCTPANTIVIENGKTITFNSQVQNSPATTSCHCDIFNNLVATTNATGDNPVSGNISSKVWVATNNSGYVKRNYEIYPEIAPDASTAKVTLYFTQAEFDEYNTIAGQGVLKLPASDNDAVGKSGIMIERRMGTSDTGLPDSYTGEISLINPDDTDIVWNSAANRWEVSFATTGFGGFFLKSPVLTDPTSVSVSQSAICSGNTVSLSAACAGGQLNWYTSASGGSSVGSGSPLIISPTSTTTYYATCEYGTNITNRVATSEVKVTLMPTTPTNAMVSSPTVCSGKNITLSATCAIGTITWYSSATGISIAGTGSNLSVVPEENASYYVACENGNCKTNRLLAGQVEVLDGPIDPIGLSQGLTKMCTGGLNFLTGYCVSGNLNWYTSATATTAAATGGYVSIAPTSNVTYYAACENSRCKSERIAMDEIVVYEQPVIPTGVSVNKTAICTGDSITLSGTCSVGTLKWYRLGAGEGVDTTFTYKPTTNSIYYASCVNGHCYSNEVATSQVEVIQKPTNPTNLYQGGRDICIGYGVYLSASCAVGTPTWYSSATGGTAIATGDYATPQPTVTTTYYVACESGNCKSQRVPYDEIVVFAQPVNPTGVSVSQTAICSGDSITLSGSCLIGTLRWYKTSMDPDTAFTYRPKMNTIYYAFCTNGFCSSDRVATSEVVVTQKPSKPSNVSVDRTTICAGENITLTASCALGTVSWYNSSSSSTTVGTGDTFSHSPIANITYYAACVNGICNSERVATDAVMVKIKPANPVVSANKTIICNGETVTLSSSIPTNTPAATLRWSSGITSSSVSINVSPTVTTNYKTIATYDGCSSDSSAVLQLVVNRVPMQPSITADNATICRGTSVILIAQCPSTTDSFYWSNSTLTNADTPGGVYKSTRTINEPGTYKGWCESNAGCKGPERSITVTAGSNCNGKDFITISPVKPILCPGSSVTLTATGCSGILTWLGGASSQTGTSIIVNPTSNITYLAQCSTGGFGSVDITVVGSAVVVNTNITTGSEKIKALNTIESAKKIGDPNFTPAPVVTFEAGKSILLKPGFVADARSVFTAQIKGCN